VETSVLVDWQTEAACHFQRDKAMHNAAKALARPSGRVPDLQATGAVITAPLWIHRAFHSPQHQDFISASLGFL